MAEVGRRHAQALVPLVLLGSVALLSLLAFNLRNLEPGAEELPPPVVSEEQDPGTAVREGSGDALRALYLVVLVSIAAIVVVGTVLLWMRGVKPWHLISKWELLAYVMGTAFLVLALLYGPAILAALGAFFGGVTGDGTSEPGPPGDPPSLPFGAPSSLLFILVIGVLSAYVFVFALAFLPRLYGVVTEEAPVVARRRELTRTVDRAIADLESGEDFRAVVLRCYKSMVLLFEGHGLRQHASQTAREFEADALRSMGLSGEGIDDLTSLFEEARYSAHPIRETQRDAAIVCLQTIRGQLEAAA